MWIISFAWTTEAFLKNRKIVTRRFWPEKTVESFWRSVQKNNNYAQGWNKNPRASGKRVGLVRVWEKPFKQKLSEMTAQDILDEGGLWSSVKEFVDMMGGPDLSPYVIQFEPILGVTYKQLEKRFKKAGLIK